MINRQLLGACRYFLGSTAKDCGFKHRVCFQCLNDFV